MFPTDLQAIEQRIEEINPKEYATSRNYKDGAVTKLSPYISRGVISTKQVYNNLLSLQLPFGDIEKLVQELAWRDYWQQVWIAKGDQINKDLKQQQADVAHHEIPKAILDGHTTIEVVDNSIQRLYETGYMHNHARMYTASLVCNIGRSHWLQPAKWMYYHLLDGDWASNALSWQWVAGSNSNKKYYANQQNINKYFNSNQQNTFIDVSYDDISKMAIPNELIKTSKFNKETILPKTENPKLEFNKKTLIYNYYNLDPKWYKEDDVQRVLLLSPSFFKKYPVSKNCIDFVLGCIENITNIQIMVGEFSELEKYVNSEKLYFKEHPTNVDYKGNEEARDWMFDVKGYYPSFFSFWKKCMKDIKP